MCVCASGRSLYTLAAGFLPASGTVAPTRSQVADDAMNLAMKLLIITSNNLHKTGQFSLSSVHYNHINIFNLANIHL